MKDRKREIEEEIASLLEQKADISAATVMYNEYSFRANSILKNWGIHDEQERFTIISDSIEKFIELYYKKRAKSNFQAIFNKICTSKARDRKKSFKNRNIISVTLDFFAGFVDEATERVNINQFRIDEVRKAINKISKDCKKRITLFFDEDLSHAEIARILNNNDDVATSRTQLSRCIKKVRSQLGLH